MHIDKNPRGMSNVLENVLVCGAESYIFHRLQNINHSFLCLKSINYYRKETIFNLDSTYKGKFLIKSSKLNGIRFFFYQKN